MGEEMHYQLIGNKIRLKRIQLQITKEKNGCRIENFNKHVF